jgi:MFS family permease
VTATRTASATDARTRWGPALVIALVALVDRLETSLVAGALPGLQAEFGFSDSWAGAIPTAAAFAGLVLLLPAGRLADRAHRTRVLAIVVLAWSFITLGAALATSFAMFFAFRVLLGAADQVDTPIGSSLLADWYPPRSRGRAYGIQRAAYFLGLPAGVVLGGTLTQLHGWRSAFLTMAIPGLFVAFLCWRLREPIRGASDPGGPPPDTPDDLRVSERIALLVRIPTVRVLLVGLPALWLGFGGIQFWMPTFLVRSHGLGEAAAAGMAGGIGGLAIIVGTAIGSVIGDRGHLQRRGWRMRVGGTGLLLGTSLVVVSVLTPALGPRIGAYALANVFLSAAIPNLTAALADVVAARNRGTGFAVLQFVLTVSGAIGPLIMGVASSASGALRAGFLILAVPMAAGSIVTLRGADRFDADVLSARAAPDVAPDDPPVAPSPEHAAVAPPAVDPDA